MQLHVHAGHLSTIQNSNACTMYHVHVGRSVVLGALYVQVPVDLIHIMIFCIINYAWLHNLSTASICNNDAMHNTDLPVHVFSA